MECAICKEEMKVQEYDASKEDGMEDNCFRLQCHHAFHTECIVSSLRIGPSCPICRDQLVQTREPINFFSLVEEDDDENQEIQQEYSQAIQIMDRKESVRHARRQYNSSITRFNICKNSLRKTRRDYIKKAMLEFKKKHYAPLQALVQDVRNQHDTLIQMEKDSFIEQQGQEEYDSASWKTLHESDLDFKEQAAAHYSVRHHDPMRKSFWFA